MGIFDSKRCSLSILQENEFILSVSFSWEIIQNYQTVFRTYFNFNNDNSLIGRGYFYGILVVHLWYFDHLWFFDQLYIGVGSL